LFKGTYNVSFPLFRLGSISVSAGDLESAIKFLSEALDVLKTYGHKSNMAPIYAELGSIYSRMGQLEKAREEYQKSLAVAEEMGDTFNTVNGLTLLVTVDINENKFDKAEAELNAILRRTDLPYHYERWCYYYLAHNEFVRGNPQKAIEIFAEAFHSDDQLKELRLAEGVYALSIEAYTVLQDWENAARFHKKLREFREQANTEQFKSRLTTAQSLIATEREKHEKELEKMKREQLERELSNTTLQLLTQTELLAEFREGILAVVRKAPPTEPIARELRERLKVLPCKSIDWDKFEAQFKAAHPEFLLTLKQQYPELSKMETRVCTLLRMNLKSADISRLTCLSERNIENHRYRIRKKLGLESDVNIHEFLAKF
jgi:tetratricopeptide (TPR) repeat protein/DNA-binding CsgD family transcriptional regulator